MLRHAVGEFFTLDVMEISPDMRTGTPFDLARVGFDEPPNTTALTAVSAEMVRNLLIAALREGSFWWNPVPVVIAEKIACRYCSLFTLDTDYYTEDDGYRVFADDGGGDRLWVRGIAAIGNDRAGTLWLHFGA